MLLLFSSVDMSMIMAGVAPLRSECSVLSHSLFSLSESKPVVLAASAYSPSWGQALSSAILSVNPILTTTATLRSRYQCCPHFAEEDVPSQCQEPGFVPKQVGSSVSALAQCVRGRFWAAGKHVSVDHHREVYAGEADHLPPRCLPSQAASPGFTSRIEATMGCPVDETSKGPAEAMSIHLPSLGWGRCSHIVVQWENIWVRQLPCCSSYSL